MLEKKVKQKSLRCGMKTVEIFEEITDFRREAQVSHFLSSILVFALYGVLSGADDFEEIAEYGKENENFLRGFILLPGGIPIHDSRYIKYLFSRNGTIADY